MRGSAVAVIRMLAAAFGRFAFGGGSGGSAGSLDTLAYRKHITIDPGAVTLADFPLAVVVAADPDLAAHARPDGHDFAFVAADGETQLAFEVEHYDGASGNLVAWVRMPEI